ncbi:CRISPR-associated endonuclease Cas3'' [Streptomyces noursei]|uniref:CRISPR-associated endonuclease Cas3'' n=1 Tax=Streptomyces noursei TaxID=1971 RepID=UPI001672794F|nr:CRISPR-associated endonuclease Cas3'' [Streptomyces noursei]MCZ1018923.1 CRISPR-associated endonuclease Cas3'' [Streptomyces noursei]GGX22767.1 CRISPR-associated helicase/endonuclease Cas3 [Streptomyces noursei]
MFDIHQGDREPDVRAAWAKLGTKRDAEPHPLICHALDTAAAAQVIAQILCRGCVGARLRRMLEPLDGSELWISALCGLHDLGKYSPTFQSLRLDVAELYLPETAQRDMRSLVKNNLDGARQDVHHGWYTTVHMQELLLTWGAKPDVARDIAITLGGHHGVFPPASTRSNAKNSLGESGAARWASWRTGLVEAFLRAWGVKAHEAAWGEVERDLGAMVVLAGLTTAADWVASDRRGLADVPTDFDLESYAEEARLTEAGKIDGIGWEAWVPPQDVSFRGLFPDKRDVRPVQEAVEKTVASLSGPGIVVIAAPAGEGKTEAGLQAATALVRKLGLAGFYVAMPTRATSNQTYRRAAELLERVGAASPLQLLHSSAAEVVAAERNRRDRTGTLQPSGIGPDTELSTDTVVRHQDTSRQDKEARGWFAHKKRGLLSPTGVGTVDQLLLGALLGRHNFLRLTGVSGKVVLFDEVHTYDQYQLALLESLLRWLGYLQVPVVLQSATLSAQLSNKLVGCWVKGSLTAMAPASDSPAPVSLPTALPYPRVMWAEACAPEPQVKHVAASALAVNRVYALHMPEDLCRDTWGQHVADALELAARDQCVGVFHNLAAQVDRDVEVAGKEIGKRADWTGIKIYGLHAGMADRERALADTMVREAFGPPDDPATSRPARAVVFGSPLLAEGADIDFDAALVALAPIDRMLQAMGRVRRHVRDRPVGAGPIPISVFGVWEETKTARNGQKTVTVHFPRFTTTVTSHALLLRTWAVLRDRSHIRLDDLQQLIDAVYGDEDSIACPEGWETQWRTAHAAMRKSIDNKRVKASVGVIPLPRTELSLEELTRPATTWRGTRLSHDSGS